MCIKAQANKIKIITNKESINSLKSPINNYIKHKYIKMTVLILNYSYVYLYHNLSTITEVAPPPPLQIPANPYLAFLNLRTLIKLITILAPLTLN